VPAEPTGLSQLRLHSNCRYSSSSWWLILPQKKMNGVILKADRAYKTDWTKIRTSKFGAIFRHTFFWGSHNWCRSPIACKFGPN
jgi:hypothetical protein